MHVEQRTSAMFTLPPTVETLRGPTRCGLQRRRRERQPSVYRDALFGQPSPKQARGVCDSAALRTRTCPSCTSAAPCAASLSLLGAVRWPLAAPPFGAPWKIPLRRSATATAAVSIWLHSAPHHCQHVYHANKWELTLTRAM